jgi:GNAT superfamily N-acetyltransferase
VEYANYLDIDLNFQNFDWELKHLPSSYATPKGDLLIAFVDNDLAGCVGLREFNSDICEMKRLYVRQEFRRKGIGLKLSKTVIDKAKKIGYKYMRLDTLPFMKEAIKLYLGLGFREIAPYRYNPIEKSKFFELEL